MALPLGEEELLADFDQRCSKGVVFYEPNPRLQTQVIDGFQVRNDAQHSIARKEREGTWGG